MKNKAWPVSLLMSISLSACALDPFTLDDPSTFAELSPDLPTVVKSLRCEVTTFIVENRLRSQIWHDILTKSGTSINESDADHASSILRDYPYIEIDSKQFAAIGFDVKNITNLGINIQNDWKRPHLNISRTFHIGPTYSDTRTFEYAPPMAIAQVADLGPGKNFYKPGTPKIPPASAYTGAYFYHPTTDEHFYCYKSLAYSNSKTLFDAANEIQQLVEHTKSYSQYAQFQRIYVGERTLAHWLQDKAADLTKNRHTMFPTPESIAIGQIYYTFTLDAKPGIDARYTLTATVINPFIPDISGSLEHSMMFYVTLNTPDAAISLGAKQGNACNKEVKDAKCK
ncbi:hypothetical protein [Methylosinus sp. LW4]|uniref:hypothetical protein n=1 Tax=Methylosinus sp. LW4 TaxID=136993 RepID=UPI0012FCD218|nr:hypothetical protein [Methylosinus sp. LW4]